MGSADLRAATDAFARRYGRRATGLVVAAMRTGSPPSVAGTGRTVRPDGQAPDGATLFEIGSITKVFTSLLLAIAVTRGEVTLDTPLRTLLPAGTEVPRRGPREISLEHLATHRSGLPRSPQGTTRDLLSVLRGGNPYAGFDPSRLLVTLARTRLRRPPGTGRIAYSNFGAGLLGLALDAAAGSPGYADLVRCRICRPLGLADTLVLEQVTSDPDRVARLAHGYGWRRQPVAHWTLTGLAGAGALLSTADDLLLFLRAQLAPDATPLGTSIRMTHALRAGGRGLGVGLGWVRSETRSGTVLWHNGGTTGFRSFAGLLPERDAAVVVLANPSRGLDRAAIRLVTRL